MSEATKQCPFCAETIQSAAVVCRYCNRDLTTPIAQKVAAPLPAAPPARSSRLIWFVLLTLVICGVPIWFVLPHGPGAVLPSSAPLGGDTYQITYEMSGSSYSGVSLTYQNATGDTEQRDVTMPWTMSFTAKGGAFLYLSGQNKGASGSVTCTIRVNNTIVKTSTSEGAYKIASCSGRL